MGLRLWRGRLTMAVGTFAVAAVVLTSCGESGPSGPPPIKIGTLMATNVGQPNWVAALKAAARDTNVHGGIKGRQVQIENCDDHFDPNAALQCAHKLINDRIVAVAGDFTEFGALQAPIFDQAGIPEVGPFVFSQEEGTLPTSFPWQGGNTNRLAGLIFGVKRRGLHSLYIAVWDVPGERALIPLAYNVARLAGIDIVGTELIPSVATNFTPYIQAVIRSKADAFYAAMPPPAQIQFMSAARQFQPKFVVALPGGELDPRDIQEIGGRDAVTENDIEFNVIPPPSAVGLFPGLRRFHADMDAEQRAGDQYAGPDWRNGGALNTWVSIEIILRLAAGLPTVTAESILRALDTSPSIDTLGLTASPWYPHRPVPRTYPRTSVPSGWFTSQINGVETLADPTPFDLYQALGYSA
jgi:ABC-type branched-subunit amino acid transport system substrate-binding protein